MLNILVKHLIQLIIKYPNLILLGFHGNLLKLLQSYFSRRRFYVPFNGYRSSKHFATSGVLQSSNLRPLFFLLFINDLFNKIKLHKLVFADNINIDTGLYNILDCLHLQNELQVLWDWCGRNFLEHNIKNSYPLVGNKKKCNERLLHCF